ncbi:hypothetical protein QBC38DRAFT_503437 [Podospora fimiseda]|uniref:Uncharacterized protein n=1 Tax=Podospora fimiseda TaxID=252190 RepID=A0AAN7BGV3_9PEZI|nr:hypothetical protein QBC38DRAFT_503437 [Podospora fimiseda]
MTPPNPSESQKSPLGRLWDEESRVDSAIPHTGAQSSSTTPSGENVTAANQTVVTTPDVKKTGVDGQAKKTEKNPEKGVKVVVVGREGAGCSLEILRWALGYEGRVIIF